MISITDCIAMCGLTEEEVLAIAEHEHVPEIVAAGLAADLLRRSGGTACIRDMIRDDVREALLRGDRAHARELLAILRHFLDAHPDAGAPEAMPPTENA